MAETITAEELQAAATTVVRQLVPRAADALLRAARTIRELEKRKVPEGVLGYSASSGKAQGVHRITWTSGEFDLDAQRFADGTWQWEVTPTVWGKYDRGTVIDALDRGYADNLPDAIRAAEEKGEGDAQTPATRGTSGDDEEARDAD